MKRKVLIMYTLILLSWNAVAQVNNGIIEGRLYNAQNNEPVPFATIVIWGSTQGVLSDEQGNFAINGIKPGYYELKVTSVGFKDYTSEPIQVTNAKKSFVEIPLEENQIELKEVTVQASPFRKREESPVSLRRIGISEIEKNPGGNRDISKVIQAFPGVASTPAYRNDVIVRGGGASENRFYLDGVEIPNLNHFATQGASGGPVGIINVDFVKEVNFYSGAFPANRGNALSSVLEFSQIDGNKDKLKFKGAVGASDLALTLDGPAGEKTTFIVSARRSYLQFLFSQLGLPFLPTYNDFQFKARTKFDEKNELTVIGLGAYDQSRLNLKANETEDQKYILNYLPVNDQWNYTFGVVYKHFGKHSYDTWVISRNHLNNIQYKYRNNIETDSLKILDYDSFESENKLRYERTMLSTSGYKVNVGANMEYAKYYNYTYRKTFTGLPYIYNSRLNFVKYGLFGQVSKSYIHAHLTLSLGIRADGNTYSKEMSNMLNQLSPRFSASYAITPKWIVNANVARYYQLPSYTTLGYRNSTGDLVNKNNGLKYISADHAVGGIELLPTEMSRLTVEGFYKWYRNYPFSLSDSISIASKGADFGTFGDEEVVSKAKGNAYGMEVLYQNMDLKGINLILSYTLVRSQSEDLAGKNIPTSWDNRHILNVTALRDLKRNWSVGFKWRFVGGAPYTPWDLDKSSLASGWDAQGRAYPDYSRFNELRLKSFHQLDLRIDKGYFFRTWSMSLYIDVQNVYGFKADEVDPLVRISAADGSFVPASGNPSRYQLKSLTETGGGTILPTIGVIVEF